MLGLLLWVVGIQLALVHGIVQLQVLHVAQGGQHTVLEEVGAACMGAQSAVFHMRQELQWALGEACPYHIAWGAATGSETVVPYGGTWWVVLPLA